MKKGERIESFVREMSLDPSGHLDPCYVGYFACFNACEYYEAHDVLEHLWLQCRDENRNFYKGLIQVAGAFVHLKKHYLRPHHHKDGRRLKPAVRLFELGIANISPAAPRHLGLDVAGLIDICRAQRDAICDSGFTRNPWRPKSRPLLELVP